MKRTEMVDKIHDKIKGSASKATIDDIIDRVFKTIMTEVAVNNKLNIKGFGTFFKRIRESRDIKTPLTKGETVRSLRSERLAFKSRMKLNLDE